MTLEERASAMVNANPSMDTIELMLAFAAEERERVLGLIDQSHDLAALSVEHERDRFAITSWLQGMAGWIRNREQG